MESRVDYYSLLGIKKSATKEEIQKVYRKLARKYHPDISGESDSVEKFKQINEAYQTLSDPEKRKLYDTYGPDWQEMKGQEHGRYSSWGNEGANHQSNGYSGNNGFEEFDFFSSIFSGDGKRPDSFHDTFFHSTADVEAELEVSLEELLSGEAKTISWKEMKRNGTGVKQVPHSVQFRIPKGMKHGSVIRLAGMGERSDSSTQRGNLLLRVNILPDDRFTVENYDLLTTISISPWEAALGAHIDVATIHGKIQVRVPKGCSSGRKLRVVGKGLPKKDGGVGDLFIFIEIQVPKNLSPREAKLFKELMTSSCFNPRNQSPQKALKPRVAV